MWRHIIESHSTSFDVLRVLCFLAYFTISVFDYTYWPCFEVKDEEDLLLEKTVRGYKTGRTKEKEPKKKNNMQAKKPYISTGLRHIFAIVSSQISTMMEPVNAILKHEPANRRLEISPRDISFLSSLSIIHGHVHTNPEIYETAQIGLLSTRNHWIRSPKPHLFKTLSRLVHGLIHTNIRLKNMRF